MGGGKGGGGAEIPQEVEDAARQLIDIGEQQFELGLPLFQEGGRQGLDILQGGAGALRPAILRGLEAGRASGSEALVDLRENLTRQGITGTELQTQLAEARQGIESQVSQIPSRFLFPTLEATASESLRLPQTGIQNISSGLSGGASAAIPQPGSGGVLGALSGAAGSATGGLLAAQALSLSNPATAALAGGAALLGGAKGAK